MNRWLLVGWLLASVTTALAQEESAPSADESAPAAESAAAPEEPVVAASGGTRTMSGMSILGNEEAPKSLVIVPWKSSRIGDEVGVTNSMNDQARPVDKEVFIREVHYFELRSGDGG